MFEVGKTYEFHAIEESGGVYQQVQLVRRVVAVDGPLVRIEGGEIINTHSPMFERAVDVEERHRWLSSVKVALVRSSPSLGDAK